MSDEPINHHTREPNVPTAATIVEGVIFDKVTYSVTLTRKAPGDVEFTLEIDGRTVGTLPFDNLVKAATRIDPDHVVGTEKQIRELRKETATAKAEMYDWQARALQAEQRAEDLDERLQAFIQASNA